MQNNHQFKVGDKILDFGQVCQIFKIKRKKDSENKDDRIIFYRPYFKTKKNKGTVCSIPAANVDKANIRKPISKKQLKEILNTLAETQKINGQSKLLNYGKICA